MDWDGKKVLVTGAGGFIGSHLTERLVKLNAKVRAFVRYNSRTDFGLIEHLPENIKSKLESIQGDLKDTNAVRDAVDGTDIVFHLGSMISIPYSYLHPRETIETNILGTLNVLMAVKENKVKKMIHTSTSEVYGTAQYVPIDEVHSLQGQSPYSASKIGADMIVESFYRTYNLPIATIRPFNTYGPRQSARAVIPTIIIQMLTNKKISLGSTYTTRDLTYVDDAVDGFIKVAESSKTIGEVVNIGSGIEICIGDLAKKIVMLGKSNAEIIFDKRRIRPKNSDVERLCANTKKARRLIGWKTSISLDDGLSKTIKWISDNLDMYKPELYNI